MIRIRWWSFHLRNVSYIAEVEGVLLTRSWDEQFFKRIVFVIHIWHIPCEVSCYRTLWQTWVPWWMCCITNTKCKSEYVEQMSFWCESFIFLLKETFISQMERSIKWNPTRKFFLIWIFFQIVIPQIWATQMKMALISFWGSCSSQICFPFYC